MKLLVSIYDKAVGAYTPPVLVKSKGEAIRSFQDHVNDKNSNVAKHPEDYILMAVGLFEEDTGLILTESTDNSYNYPEKLITALELVTENE